MGSIPNGAGAMICGNFGFRSSLRPDDGTYKFLQGSIPFIDLHTSSIRMSILRSHAEIDDPFALHGRDISSHRVLVGLTNWHFLP